MGCGSLINNVTSMQRGGSCIEYNQMCDALCKLGGPLWENVVVSQSEALVLQWVDPFVRTTVLHVLIACITAANGYVATCRSVEVLTETCAVLE